MKIFIFLFVFALWVQGAYGAPGDRPIIISREEWGADTDFNSKEGAYWQKILTDRQNAASKTVNPETQKKIAEKNKKINDYLYGNFEKQFTSQETLYYNFEEGYSYAWPLKYTDYVDSIIIHHTTGDYPESLDGIKKIHKFHSISRQWGDIGYHYLIGEDGKIYEGKEGGDYVVGAHSKYNNFGSVGIALMGDYRNHHVTNSQKESLESLVQYLILKYGIDLNNKRYYHMNCAGKKCNTFPIETYLDDVLVGHKHTGHTSCPGVHGEAVMEEIHRNNLEFSAGLKPVLRKKTGDNREESDYKTSQIFIYKKYLLDYDKKSLSRLKRAIEIAINSGRYDEEITKKLQILRLSVVLSLKD